MSRPTAVAISVILPSHGHRRFLPERLAAIAGQTRRPDELIIIDDGSTDGSASWLREWRGEFPVQLECRATAGGSPFAIWNDGVARARGDWVWIAESDDTCEPEFLATLLAAAARRPDAALVMCQSTLIDEHGQNVGSFADYTRPHDTETWRHDFALEGRAAATRLLLARNTIPNVSACLISRRAWLAAGGADASLSLCGDWLTYARLLVHGSLVFCAAPLNHYRQHRETQRARTARSEYVRQSYVARRHVAELHAVHEHAMEFARRYAWNETTAALGGEASLLPAALSPEAHAAARAFDPNFDARATGGAPRAWDYYDIFVEPGGAFAEANKRRQPIRIYDEWQTLVFPGGTGRVRLDPLARPGRCWLRSVARHEPGTGRVLWSADATNRFAELQAGPGVTLTAEGEALVIDCTHEDAQLYLRDAAGAGTESFDLVVEMRYTLE